MYLYLSSLYPKKKLFVLISLYVYIQNIHFKIMLKMSFLLVFKASMLETFILILLIFYVCIK